MISERLASDWLYKLDSLCQVSVATASIQIQVIMTVEKLCAGQCPLLLLYTLQHAQVVKPALGNTLCSDIATFTATYSRISDMLFDACCSGISAHRRDCIVAQM